MRPSIARLAMAITLPASRGCATQAYAHFARLGRRLKTKPIALANLECDNCTLQMLQNLARSSR